jgi:hypothetical protein
MKMAETAFSLFEYSTQTAKIDYSGPKLFGSFKFGQKKHHPFSDS